jgi:hypothetical protein
MAKKLLAGLITTKTLIRIAVSILSLGGIAHAHAETAQQTDTHYNFMVGGGG